MSALPLIEAVERAGGAITLRGDRLRLSAPEPLPEHLLHELRTRKAEVIDHLRHARGPRRPAAQAGANRTAPRVEVVTGWAAGVARLGAMPLPRHHPEHAWRQLIVDAERFLDNWAQQAVTLGWQGWELFGCHRHAPWGRIQGMGLVLLLRGRELAALTGTAGVIRTARRPRLTYYHKPRDPLHPAERCLVWELANA